MGCASDRTTPDTRSMTEPLTDFGSHVHAQSMKLWGDRGAVHMVGRSRALRSAQEKLRRFVTVDRPVLLTGESGVGKELFARSLYLLSPRRGRAFLSVNCAQYQNDDLLVSEIFGHKKGSFTGAWTDNTGLFEAADGGVLFLDEVGELSPRAQAMLLRALSEGEIKPLGATEVRHVDVHVVTATNRPLKQMVAEKSFREDLYYRLQYLHVHVPPIREREDDWHLLVDFFLGRSNGLSEQGKQFSPSAWSMLGKYDWPGNVREIQSVVDVGCCLTDGQTIDTDTIREVLADPNAAAPGEKDPALVKSLYADMLEDGRDFWEVVREPFLDRELNRAQVRAIVQQGLADSRGSYKQLLHIFRIDDTDYLKFMDFLRHHRLKPRNRC